MLLEHYCAIAKALQNTLAFTKLVQNGPKTVKKGVPLFLTRFWEPSTYLGTPRAGWGPRRSFLSDRAVSNRTKTALGGSTSRWGGPK